MVAVRRLPRWCCGGIVVAFLSGGGVVVVVGGGSGACDLSRLPPSLAPFTAALDNNW